MPRFTAAHARLIQAIRERAFPGAAYGVFLRGCVEEIEATGSFTYDPAGLRVQPDTVFDLASLTKVLATTAMAMLLWERGHLYLDEPVGRQLPEFVRFESPDSTKRNVTPRMLLAHSSGLPAYERLYERCESRAELLDAAMRMPLETAPGSRAAYSDIGFIVLGHLLETLAGERLDSFCDREVFTPLDMTATRFCPPAEWKPLIPPTRLYDLLRCREIQGEVHDGNCWMLGGVGGHAGIFSNVADTLRFAGCMLRGGTPIFRPQTVSLFTAPQALLHRPSGQDRALGWDTPSSPSSSGSFFSAHSVGHLGYTGTSLWIDFEKELAIALLTNRTFPDDAAEGPSQKIQQVRPQFHDALLRELKLAAG